VIWRPKRRQNMVGMDNRKISEMRNLGPVCEEVLSAAGIETEQVIQLGIEEVFERMVAVRIARGERNIIHAAFLYALYGAVEDVAWQDVPEAKKREFKAAAISTSLTRRVSRRGFHQLTRRVSEARANGIWD